MYRFLLRPGWLAAHVLLLVVLTTFVSLGMWQLRRLDERRDYNRRFTSRTEMPVRPLDALAPTLPEDDAEPLSYRRVTITGTYRPADEFLLLSRSRNSIAGHHVVTPLVTDAGYAVLVDRGWVPLDMNEAPVVDAPPPGGRVTVTGVLFPSQERGRFGPRIPPGGTVRSYFRIEIPRLREQIAYPLFPQWLHLEDQAPANPARYPAAARPRPLSEGPHLSYALQWFAFTIAALVTYAVFARRRGVELAAQERRAREMETIGSAADPPR